MPLEVRCPNPKCGCLLKASTLAGGKQVPCPKCGTPITVPDVSDDDTLLMSGSPSDSLIGCKLAHYEILSELGSGGMGVVYKVRNVSLDKIVALKVLPEYISKHDRELVARFIREARAAAKLEHPNITPVYFAGRIGKRYFIEMQYVEGKSLGDLIEKEGRFTPAAATRLVQGVAQALKVAHENGIIHRDVKPSNIILDRNGVPKVTDFGLAKVTETETGVTTSGQVLGTPDYMSPEQSRGEEVDKRSDIYSLGATYYMLLTGKTLFRGKTVMQVLLQHMDTPPPSPRETVPDLPVCACRIVARMLAKKPEERYQDCDELIAELQAAFQSLAVAPVEKKASRLPYLLAAGLAGAAIAGAAVFFLIERSGTPAPGPRPGRRETHPATPPSVATEPIPKPAEPGPAKVDSPEPTPPAAKIDKPLEAPPPGPLAPPAPVPVKVPPGPEPAKQTPAEQPPVQGQAPPEAPPFDAAAYARDTEDVDELIGQLDLERAHIRALELVPKYPKQAGWKAENIERLEEFLERIFARISSGEIHAEMKDLSRRFAYAGRISRIDRKGVAAQDGKFEKEWRHFKKEELYQLLRKCLGETATSTDKATLAILLAEGATDETCLALAEGEMAKSDEKGDEVQRAIATVGLAREVLSARAAKPEAAPAPAPAPAPVASGKKELVERLVPENRPLAGNLLLHETFDDNTRLWEQTEKESNRCMVEKGVYHLQSREAGPARLRGTAIAHGDGILHASVKLAALDDPERSRLGLCIRRGKTGPFYIFCLAPTQCSLDKIKPSVTGGAATETLAANPHVKTKDLVGKTVEMEILANGPAVRCYLDGERVLDVVDPEPSLEGERIEVCLAGNIEVVVDDVILFDLLPSAAKLPAKADSDAQARAETAAMEGMKELKKRVEKELSIELATVETGHFILHGNLPKGHLEGIGKAGEKVYAKLCSIFDVGKKQRLWPGKYAVFAFGSKEEYRNYLTKVCHVERAGHADLVSSPLPQKAGVVGFVSFSAADSSDDLTGTYYWFLSTDFLRRYKQGKGLPAWVEAGFREYCKRTMAGDPLEPKRTRTEVKSLVQRGESRGLKEILAAKEFPPTDASGRTLCFSLVDYAVSRGPKQFVEFVGKIKDGADQETALREAFGRPLDEFEAGWKAFIDKKY